MKSGNLERKALLQTSLVIALLLLVPAAKSVAQASGGDASSQTQPAQVQAPQEVSADVKEVYYPFNIYNKVMDPAVLDADASWLKSHPDVHFWIQAYADIRGDIVYNLVLSYRRAQWLKTSLVNRGVDASQIGFATGWGKLYQVCEQKDEACFQKNRRGDMIPPQLFPM